MGNSVQRRTKSDCQHFQHKHPNKECCWDVVEPTCKSKGHASCIEHKGGKVVHKEYTIPVERCLGPEGYSLMSDSQNDYLIWIILILAVVICVYCYNKKK